MEDWTVPDLLNFLDMPSIAAAMEEDTPQHILNPYMAWSDSDPDPQDSSLGEESSDEE